MRFEFATAARIIFGEGTAATLPDLARSFGSRPMLITGASRGERKPSSPRCLRRPLLCPESLPSISSVREHGSRRMLHVT
jgi:hypothetical protein